MSPAVINIINAFLMGMPCLLLIFMTFWDRRRRSPAPVIMGIILFSVIIITSIYFYFVEGFSPILRAFVSICVMFISIGLFCFFIKYNFWKSLFIVIILNCYTDNVRLLSHYGYFVAAGNPADASPVTLTIVKAVFTLLTFPPMYLFAKRLLKPALSYTISHRTWECLWVVPFLNNLIFMLIITPESPFGRLPVEALFYLIPPLWTLMTFVTFTFLLKIIVQMAQNAELAENLRIAEIQAAAQQRQNDLLLARIEETSRLRHDIRHHFIVLSEMANTQNIPGIQRYLMESRMQMPQAPSQVYCANSAINALLSYFKESAEQEQIGVSLSVFLADELPFPDNDISLILGNLMENAIEACKRMQSNEKSIHLRISMPSRQTLVILCQNTYEGKIRKLSDESFLSSKSKNRRGIGITSIISIVKKYGGVHKFEHYDGIFKVSLLLNAKKQP